MKTFLLRLVSSLKVLLQLCSLSSTPIVEICSLSTYVGSINPTGSVDKIIVKSVGIR